MKNLFSLIGIACIISLFTSCTTYQYATLNSNLPQPSQEGFLYENDTVEINYSFGGPNCPLILTIYNKLDAPIFVDWNQSAVIINGNSFALKTGQSEINTRYSESTVKLDRTFEFTDGSAQGTIYHPDQSGFIPPKAKLSVNEISIVSEFLPTIAGTKEKKQIQGRAGSTFEVSNFIFSKPQTPLEFRCFLTYKDKDMKNPRRIDSEFWVSSLFKLNGSTLKQRNDRYYVSKSSGAGVAVGLVAVAGLVVIAAEYSEPEAVDTY